MGSNRRSTLAVSACAISLLLAALLTLSPGAVRLSLIEFFYGLRGIDSPAGRILPHVRVSRLLTIVLAEARLSVSGVLIQTVLQNPSASPGTIGVNAGAGLAVALCMTLLPGVALVFPLAVFLGALTSVLLVYGIARRVGVSRTMFALSGVALSSLMTAGINTSVTVFPGIMTGLRDFQNGGFEGVSIGILRPVGLVILFGLLMLLLFARELDMFGLGGITASSLRLSVRFYRFLFLALTAIPAGAVVSFVGLLGFVGLIVPHVACFLPKGSGKWSFLLLSVLLEAAFLILCDTAAQTVFAPFELSVGILVAYLGVPFFLWPLFRERRKHHD